MLRDQMRQKFMESAGHGRIAMDVSGSFMDGWFVIYIYRHSPVIKRGNENFLINRGMNGNILYGWGNFQQDMLEITGLDMKSHGNGSFWGRTGDDIRR